MQNHNLKSATYLVNYRESKYPTASSNLAISEMSNSKLDWDFQSIFAVSPLGMKISGIKWISITGITWRQNIVIE
jgi:hypothetical protein